MLSPKLGNVFSHAWKKPLRIYSAPKTFLHQEFSKPNPKLLLRQNRGNHLKSISDSTIPHLLSHIQNSRLHNTAHPKTQKTESHCGTEEEERNEREELISLLQKYEKEQSFDRAWPTIMSSFFIFFMAYFVGREEEKDAELQDLRDTVDVLRLNSHSIRAHFDNLYSTIYSLQSKSNLVDDKKDSMGNVLDGREVKNDATGGRDLVK